jgi:two-component system, LytTR family, response regulator
MMLSSQHYNPSGTLCRVMHHSKSPAEAGRPNRLRIPREKGGPRRGATRGTFAALREHFTISLRLHATEQFPPPNVSPASAHDAGRPVDANDSMTKLRVLIVDDEPLARERVRTFLRTESAVEVVGEFENGMDALAAIRRKESDIVFLDVQMPGCGGLQVLADLPPGPRPAIVLVTAHNRFAVDAFAAQVTDFLLKPFDRERFQLALRRAIDHVNTLRAGNLETRVETLLAAAPTRTPERLAVRADGRVVFLKLDEIVWVEAANNYSIFHLSNAKRLLLRDTLSSFEKRLGASHFARVNRSALVHVDQVQELQPSKYGDYLVVLRDGTRLSLSRNLRSHLEKLVPGAL